MCIRDSVEGEDNSLLDVLVNDDSTMADRSLVNESLAREIDRALCTLTDREKEIIQMFFGIGQQEMTLEEIGDKFGLTREPVSYTHLMILYHHYIHPENGLSHLRYRQLQ